VIHGFLPMLTPLIIIFGILSGIFTPTEASVVALFYCIFIAFFVYKAITLRQFFQILKETALDTAVLLFIIGGSALYSWVLARYQVTDTISSYLSENISSTIVLLILVNLFILLIGCFIDSVPALFLLTPILVPLVVKFGVDPIHFGVIMIFNLMLGLITPPIGTVLFTIQKVTNISFSSLVKEVAPFYVPLFIVLGIITYFPSVVMLLPNLVLK
jgi:tripartite ATP-independent transporter DctM subunit